MFFFSLTRLWLGCRVGLGVSICCSIVQAISMSNDWHQCIGIGIGFNPVHHCATGCSENSLIEVTWVQIDFLVWASCSIATPSALCLHRCLPNLHLLPLQFQQNIYTSCHSCIQQQCFMLLLSRSLFTLQNDKLVNSVTVYFCAQLENPAKGRLGSWSARLPSGQAGDFHSLPPLQQFTMENIVSFFLSCPWSAIGFAAKPPHKKHNLQYIKNNIKKTTQDSNRPKQLPTSPYSPHAKI